MTTNPKAAKLLDVGNCNPDHGSIRQMLERHFDVQIDRVMFVPDAIQKLRTAPYDLVLVNRLVFDDGSPGMALVEAIQADATLKGVPVMMISNFPDAQAVAVSAGAQPGFGKAGLNDPATLDRLSKFLPKRHN